MPGASRLIAVPGQAEALQEENTILLQRVLSQNKELTGLDTPAQTVKRKRREQTPAESQPKRELDQLFLKEAKGAFPLWKRWVVVAVSRPC